MSQILRTEVAEKVDAILVDLQHLRDVLHSKKSNQDTIVKAVEAFHKALTFQLGMAEELERVEICTHLIKREELPVLMINSYCHVNDVFGRKTKYVPFAACMRVLELLAKESIPLAIIRLYVDTPNLMPVLTHEILFGNEITTRRMALRIIIRLVCCEEEAVKFASNNTQLLSYLLGGKEKKVADLQEDALLLIEMLSEFKRAHDHLAQLKDVDKIAESRPGDPRVAILLCNLGKVKAINDAVFSTLVTALDSVLSERTSTDGSFTLLELAMPMWNVCLYPELRVRYKEKILTLLPQMVLHGFEIGEPEIVQLACGAMMQFYYEAAGLKEKTESIFLVLEERTKGMDGGRWLKCLSVLVSMRESLIKSQYQMKSASDVSPNRPKKSNLAVETTGSFVSMVPQVSPSGELAFDIAIKDETSSIYHRTTGSVVLGTPRGGGRDSPQPYVTKDSSPSPGNSPRPSALKEEAHRKQMLLPRTSNLLPGVVVLPNQDNANAFLTAMGLSHLVADFTKKEIYGVRLRGLYNKVESTLGGEEEKKMECKKLFNLKSDQDAARLYSSLHRLYSI